LGGKFRSSEASENDDTRRTSGDSSVNLKSWVMERPSNYCREEFPRLHAAWGASVSGLDWAPPRLAKYHRRFSCEPERKPLILRIPEGPVKYRAVTDRFTRQVSCPGVGALQNVPTFITRPRPPKFQHSAMHCISAREQYFPMSRVKLYACPATSGGK
jgi:hypothetical protein